MGNCQSSVNVKTPAARNGGGKAPESNSKRITSVDLSTLINKISRGGRRGSLHQIPGRLFLNGASRIASLYSQQGMKGVNQDAMLVWENFGVGNATVCGVFDGHGPYGHMVARRVRDALPVFLRLLWEISLQNGQFLEQGNGNHHQQVLRRFDGFLNDEEDDDDESVEDNGNEAVPEMNVEIKKSMLKAFKLMDRELDLHPTMDCYCSGTTAVVLVVEGYDLIIGNIGDSRAVLATRDSDNNLVASQLTVDLKPDLPGEAARIQKCKGRVFAMPDEPEVARIWLPHSDSPGLAMARAFGDFCLKDFGLISVPDVHYHRITDRDEFVILASDGVWDAISNEEAVNIVASSPSRGIASRALVACATRAWLHKYPTSKIDDCAAVVLFLDHISHSDAENTSDDATVLKDCDEINSIPEDPMKRSVSRSRLGDLIDEKDEEWSALGGVSRVNSLINLPRFMPALGRLTSRRKGL